MFSLFRDAQQLETVETQLVEMLETCSSMFELAVGALMRTSDPAAVADEIFALDKELNRTERGSDASCWFMVRCGGRRSITG